VGYEPPVVDVLAHDEHPIAIDYHKGCLMLATSNRLLLWNVQNGNFKQGIVANEAI